MKGLLLDTSVVSELRKGRRMHAGVRRWFAEVDEPSLFLSVLVVGEIRRGIETLRRRDARSAQALDVWLARVVRTYGDRVLAVDRDIADEWGRLDAMFGLAAVDGLLAATAIVRDLVLVTRNTKDVARTGVPLLDPFLTT